jgi:ribosomal protein L19
VCQSYPRIQDGYSLFQRGQDGNLSPSAVSTSFSTSMRFSNIIGLAGHKIKIFAPPRSARKQCPEPIKTANAAEIAKLDPTGTRTRLFALDNPDAIQVRDIVLVRTKSGDPFAGVVMRIKRAAQNTGILLRNTVTGTGVEMDFKVYSPNVTGIEVVQRRPKKPKQHRLYYLRYAKYWSRWKLEYTNTLTEIQSTTLALWTILYGNISGPRLPRQVDEQYSRPAQDHRQTSRRSSGRYAYFVAFSAVTNVLYLNDLYNGDCPIIVRISVQ